MAFSEPLKARVRRKAAYRCCACQKLFVEVHHIVPQSVGGADTEENAAPLCANCHSDFGGNPDLRKKIIELRDHWYGVVTVKFPTREDVALEALNNATRSGSPQLIKEELQRYAYSLISSVSERSLPKLTDLLVQGLYLDKQGHVPVEDLADEGPCACDRQTCVASDHRVYCYFTKDQSPWVIGKHLYWRCYDEIITCPRCRLQHPRGHVGRDEICARPYRNQRDQTDAD